MDADSWSVLLSSASKRYQSGLQSRSDMFMGFEEMDGDDDIREEFPCPFCSEYFDIDGLCCHIDDEHPAEAKNGSLTVNYMQRKRKCRKGGSYSTLSLLRRELREGNLQSLLEDLPVLLIRPMWHQIHCCRLLFCQWLKILGVLRQILQLTQPLSRKAQMRMLQKGMFNHLLYQSRIRRKNKEIRVCSGSVVVHYS